MTKFLDDVVNDLLKKNTDISNITFVLPNKRAGLFLKASLARAINKTIFSPIILSIEELTENISGLSYATNTELLFSFYDTYLNVTPQEEIESLENVFAWSNMLIQDFNNIDRYLIDPNRIFDYLKDIKELDHWSKNSTDSENISSYLQFWKRLKIYYTQFKKNLLLQNIGYQGMVYRKAVDNIDAFSKDKAKKKYVFVGFNALNKAEEIIFQYLVKQEVATVYWDADTAFISNNYHDAGHFLRSFKKNWAYYKTRDFTFTSSHYSIPKHIEAIGTPKNVGQVKIAGELLANIVGEQGNLDDTALVLSDENLILPLLNSLPFNVGPLNVTMGIPLKSTPVATFFELLFRIHKQDLNKIYFKDVEELLSHPILIPLFDEESYQNTQNLIAYINKNNIIYIDSASIIERINNSLNPLKLILTRWQSVGMAISNVSQFIRELKDFITPDTNQYNLSLEYLYRFNVLFNELKELNNSYNTLKDIASLHTVYRQLLKIESLDFKGEPLKGLQIMGMLETRVLDFKNVIILSLNEGILPAGKGENSFIPFDVKRENQLPTYKEMDAVYTYHFYRLIQRASNIYLIYNTEADVLNGGEKSRFIAQMEFEKIHTITYRNIAPIAPATEKKLEIVSKTDDIMATLKEVAGKGFSPSSLTNYIRNPIDFYYQKILGIKETDLVEETVAANTLGTVIHKSLETIYLPYLNIELTEDMFDKIKNDIANVVAHHFKVEYKQGDATKGKNLIIMEICKRYVFNLVNKDKDQVKKGNSIIILALEKEFNTQVNIEEIPYNIYLKGNVDRIDRFNGTIRIIDYKTGRVDQGQVEIVNWNEIATDYKKYSKSFQILCYAYLLNSESPIEEIEAGIISLKNLTGNHFLKFGIKPSLGSRTKNQKITQETLVCFENELKKLILEICNKEIDFIEKEL